MHIFIVAHHFHIIIIVIVTTVIIGIISNDAVKTDLYMNHH